MPYCTMLQWKGLQWEFKLHPICRILSIPPPGNDFLSSDNIRKLEETFCTSLVKADCAELLESLLGRIVAFLRSWESINLQIANEQTEVDAQKLQSDALRSDFATSQGNLQQLEAVCEDHQEEVKKIEQELGQLRAAVQVASSEADKRGSRADGQGANESKTFLAKLSDLEQAVQVVNTMKEEIRRKKLEVGTKEEELDVFDIKLSKTRKDFSNEIGRKQSELLDKLRLNMKQATDSMLELRASKQYKFLANMHATPGLSAAQEFLQEMLSESSRIAASGRQVIKTRLFLCVCVYAT